MPNTPDIDVSALAEALNEKLDRDGGNATNTIKEMMANASMPSNIYYINLTSTNGSTYVAPADGYIAFRQVASASVQFVILGIIDSTGSYRYFENGQQAAGSGQTISTFIPITKGAKVQIWNTLGGTFYYYRFIYANGSSHLASN